MEKLSNACFTVRDHELLSGDIFKRTTALWVNKDLIPVAIELIGLAEMRKALGYAPLGPWTHYQVPSEEEIASASTIEEYYELREPRDQMRSLDNEHFYERNVPPAIASLDKRFPEIRAIFRLKFGEIRRHSDVSREQIDRMIDEFNYIEDRIAYSFISGYICTVPRRTV
uniref:Thymidylate synthase n=1 Tax=Caenorhabditis tropicalis TaxID=1561998 RepID=A0A1I7U6E8_9PELO